MTTFYIKAKEAKQIADGLGFCMSKDQTRYYLNGVYIHNKGKQLFAVATDGHRLGRLWLSPYGVDGTRKDSLKEDFGYILPRNAVEWLGRLNLPKRSNIELVRFDFNDDKVTTTLLPDNQSAVFTLVEADYPDYERVIPSERGKMEVGFNSSYLADFGKAASKLMDTKATRVTLHISDPADPCIVTCDHERALYVLMPMRI